MYNGTYEFLQREAHFTIVHYMQRRSLDLQTIHSGCDVNKPTDVIIVQKFVDVG
jgi:hypothetical protein